MLEQYFIKPQTLDRIRHSWLGEPIENYVTWLTERGYAARNVYRRVPILMHFAEFARARGASTFDELPALVDGFVAHWVRTHRRRVRTKQAKPWVASNPTSPTRRGFCRFSFFSATQVIELLNPCPRNSPQMRL